MPHRVIVPRQACRNTGRPVVDRSRQRGGPATGGKEADHHHGSRGGDLESIARTLARYHDTGLGRRFTAAQVAPATRVFDTRGLDFPGFDDPVSFDRDGPTATPDLALPSFAFAPPLVEGAGSRSKLLEVLEYIRTTVLSTSYREQLDWIAFVTTSTTPRWIAQQLRHHGIAVPRLRSAGEGLAARVQARLQRIDGDAAVWADVLGSADAEVRQRVAMVVVALLGRIASPSYARALEHLGLPGEPALAEQATPYAVLRTLLPRFDDASALLGTAASELGIASDSLAIWRICRLLFEKNTVLDPSLRPFLLPALDRPCRAPTEEPSHTQHPPSETRAEVSRSHSSGCSTTSSLESTRRPAHPSSDPTRARKTVASAEVVAR